MTDLQTTYFWGMVAFLILTIISTVCCVFFAIQKELFYSIYYIVISVGCLGASAWMLTEYVYD